jgi:hypothetical protein
MKEKVDINVKYRWIFHILINVNIFSLLFYNLFAVFAIYYGFFSYEGVTIMDDIFYQNKLFSNFSSMPNGYIIDLCTSTEGGNIDTFFNFTYYYEFYDNLINEGISIREAYKNTPPSEDYNKFVDISTSMLIDSFEAIENRNIKWDLNGEQINFFLYPLESYKYFNPRIIYFFI